MARVRRTRAEIEAFDEALYENVRAVHPCTCRQIYYKAVVAGIADKDDRGYRQVCESLSRQRWNDSIPWAWISDDTRGQRMPQVWADGDSGYSDFAETYRRDLWREQPVFIEVWVESDSLAGTLVEVTWRLGVPLYSGRGFSSLSAIRIAAEHMARRWEEREQETLVLYVGDLDPAGWEAPLAAQRGLEQHLVTDLLPDTWPTPLAWSRVAVNPNQVDLYDLPPGGKPKANGPGSTSWWTDDGPALPYAVQAEALDPVTLRQIVEHAVLKCADTDALERGWRVEELEREALQATMPKVLSDLERYRAGEVSP